MIQLVRMLCDSYKRDAQWSLPLKQAYYIEFLCSHQTIIQFSISRSKQMQIRWYKEGCLLIDACYLGGHLSQDSQQLQEDPLVQGDQVAQLFLFHPVNRIKHCREQLHSWNFKEMPAHGDRRKDVKENAMLIWCFLVLLACSTKQGSSGIC